MFDKNQLDDMITTDDRSMVKVEMLDEVIRRGEPYRYLGVNEALEAEACGVCRIVRKSDAKKYQRSPDGKFVVEHLERPLIESYGKYRSYTLREAETGERMGKWRICRDSPEKSTGEIKMLVFNVAGPKVYETKTLKKRAVAWIQDNFKRGGAEISSELVVQTGRDCGFRIEMLDQRSSAEGMKKLFAESDLIVIGNIWGFNHPQMESLLDAIHVGRKPYVKYEHDHRELQRKDFSRKLFQNARLNFFLSPAHLANHQRELGISLAENSVVLPLAIDVDLFRPVPGVERKKGTALVCNTRSFKLWSSLQKYIDDHPEIYFTLLSNDGAVVKGVNVKVISMVSYENVPRIYSEYEYLVHLLDGWGAGERVIFEAALMGLKIIANDHVGHMSWNKDLTDINGLKEWLRGAPYEFWRRVNSFL